MELLAEMAKFIPYYLKKYDEEIMKERRSQAIFSSYVLSSHIHNLWLRFQQNRRQKVMEIGQKLRELKNGRFDQEFNRTRQRYSLLCDLNWYWENPANDGETLCVDLVIFGIVEGMLTITKHVLQIQIGGLKI